MVEEKEIYQYFADYIFQHTGMIYNETDFYRLESRLKELASFMGCNNLIDAYNAFRTNVSPTLHNKIIDIATNNETYFIRDTKPFEAVAKHIIPELFQKKLSHEKVRIWSCACSNGQEPYSILMSILEENPSIDISSIEITATDISESCLKKAKSGLYTGLEVQRGLPITMLLKHFTKTDDECWKINDSLTNAINFKEFNIVKDRYPIELYDIIFCRNVIIYQNQENKKIIVKNLFQSLKPNGHLFFGSGESLIGTKLTYSQQDIANAMVFQKS